MRKPSLESSGNWPTTPKLGSKVSEPTWFSKILIKEITFLAQGEVLLQLLSEWLSFKVIQVAEMRKGTSEMITEPKHCLTGYHGAGQRTMTGTAFITL